VVYIKDISDIRKLKSEDIFELFSKGELYKRVLDKKWSSEGNVIKKFQNPLDFLEGAAETIKQSATSSIDEDYWLLILGEPGTGKSTLSVALYKHIMFKLGYTLDEIKDRLYLDVCYLPYDYLGRVNLHSNEIEDRGNKIFSHPIILDEAHNMFDLFAEGSTNVARRILQRIFEIREYRLIHIVNTQIPRQIAKRALERFHSLIILWKEPIYFGEKDTKELEETYFSYMENILKIKPKTEEGIGYFLWGAFYGERFIHDVLEWIIENKVNIKQLRKILMKFNPKYIFPMTLILHEVSELRPIYFNIKLYNNGIKRLYDEFGIKGSKKAVFLKALAELGKNFDKINPDNKDEKENIKLDEPISIDIDDKIEYKALKKIGKAKLFLDIEKEDGGKLDHRKAISEYYYVNIYSVNPKIYKFLKNNYITLQKRYRLHEAIGFKL
jgi:DNA polymerase III delta prime subunit